MQGRLLTTLFALLLSSCAYLETNSRLQQLDDLQRGYARAIIWSNLVSAYSATRRAQASPSPEANEWQNIKVTAYEPAIQKAENDGKTIRRVVQIRYVHTTQMVENKLTVEEEWKYSEDTKRWVLESGFPQFR